MKDRAEIETQYERPKIGAIVPWAGAKRTLAPLIVQELGPHRCYHEPFCGSMAVLLAKPPVHMEVVNDLHGDLVNFARVLQDDRQGPGLYRKLKRTLFAEEVFEASADWIRTAEAITIADEPDAERAYHFFVVSWCGRNGISGTPDYNRNFCARFTYGGGSPAVRYANAIASIPAWRRRLRRVAVYRMDAFDHLARIADEAGTVIYADPPYFEKGFRYVHDFDEADHARLAEALARFHKARVVLSYYEDPRLDALYPGWTRRSLKCLKQMGLSIERGSRANNAPEVLLINGPSRLAYGDTNQPLLAEGEAEDV